MSFPVIRLQKDDRNKTKAKAKPNSRNQLPKTKLDRPNFETRPGFNHQTTLTFDLIPRSVDKLLMLSWYIFEPMIEQKGLASIDGMGNAT
jgi:hypothetical protein